MGVLYLIGFLCFIGFNQGEPLRNNEHAFIEDLRSGGSRVVAGWLAKDGQIPHQVSLKLVRQYNGNVGSCGGSVIHHEWVITAAHCLAQRVSVVVRLGLTNLTRPEWMVETTRKFLHPEYDESSSIVQTHDIALVGLEHHIPYGPTIQPIRLQNSLQKNLNYNGVVFTVSGFGQTDDFVNGGLPSEVLQWVYLRGITNEECLEWYTGSTAVNVQTVCAEYYNDTAQSSCQGDSGGPLTMVDKDGRLTMAGIVSFGARIGCNSPFPSGYVRPGHYHSWIREVTGIDFDWRFPNEGLPSVPSTPEDVKVAGLSQERESPVIASTI